MFRVSAFVAVLALALSFFAVSCSAPTGVQPPMGGSAVAAGPTTGPTGAAAAPTTNPSGTAVAAATPGGSAPGVSTSAISSAGMAAVAYVSSLLKGVTPGSEMFFLFVLTVFIALGILSLLVSHRPGAPR